MDENTKAVVDAIAKENARVARSGGDAFPRTQDEYGGLTKREYMATALMAAIARPGLLITGGDAAITAVAFADALLAELAK